MNYSVNSFKIPKVMYVHADLASCASFFFPFHYFSTFFLCLRLHFVWSLFAHLHLFWRSSCRNWRDTWCWSLDDFIEKSFCSFSLPFSCSRQLNFICVFLFLTLKPDDYCIFLFFEFVYFVRSFARLARLSLVPLISEQKEKL